MLKKVMIANKKRLLEYQQTTYDLIFFLLINIRELLQRKSNPRFPRLPPSSGVSVHCSDLPYGSYAIMSQ